jgi:hypothetical protein
VRARLPLLAAAAALLATGVPVVSASGAAPVGIEVLSNRADLVSGGNALVEVRLPHGADAAGLRVTAGDRDVTDAFAVRADGRVLGRVEGLPVGTTTLTAAAPGAVAAALDVTNHPIGGPVFTGRQIQPWVCTTASNGLGAPQDAQCNAPTVVTFHYKRTSGSGLAAYDPANPPTDVATTTTDTGAKVPFIVRQEKGTMNRGIYTLAVLYDPAKPFEPWARQAGWNGKLYYPFGASCGTVYSQGSAQSVLNEDALSRGFMVATSSLNVLGSSCNTHVSAESVMMLKEHVVERYGQIRFTFGNGSSGGAIGQQMVANNYPGLLQGLTVGLAYADNGSTGQEVFDCHVLFQYFTRTSPHLWGNAAQQAAVTGHGTSPATCAGWEVLFSAVADPTNGCGNVPHYNAQTNPTGCRGTYQDFNESILGKRDRSVWTEPEKKYGGFAKALYDNVGVQFGLKALQDGLITTEQFVDLNEKVGGFDIDFQPTKERSRGDADFAEIVYKTGTVNDARQLDQVAIIDSRGLGNVDPLLIHTMHHSFALKERIRKVHGTAENHVVWRGSAPASAFDTMDAWLTAVEADKSGASLAEKIRANRPAVARDSCRVGGRDFVEKGFCDTVYPYYGAPRTEPAGGPITHDVASCQLRPLDRSDDYGPVPFTDEQWARLLKAFPDGACDWSRPSRQLTPSVPWATYADGPGGRPLGPAPQSRPVGG